MKEMILFKWKLIKFAAEEIAKCDDNFMCLIDWAKGMPRKLVHYFWVCLLVVSRRISI